MPKNSVGLMLPIKLHLSNIYVYILFFFFSDTVESEEDSVSTEEMTEIEEGRFQILNSVHW